MYRRTPITLEQASKTNGRVKIITTDKKRMVFRKIEKIDSMYYGKYKDQSYKTVLKESNIREIRPANKGLSTVLTVSGAVLIAATITLTIVAVELSSDLGSLDLEDKHNAD